MCMARILAASDMAAGEAYPKLVPWRAKREAFLATAGARRHLSNLTHMFATLSQRYHIGVVATGRIECGKMPNALTRPPTDTVTRKTECSCKSVGHCADIGLSGSDCQRTSNVTQAMARPHEWLGHFSERWQR